MKRPKPSIYLHETLEEIIQAQQEYYGNRSSVVNGIAERYAVLVQYSMPKLSLSEWRAILESTENMNPSVIPDVIKLTNLDASVPLTIAEKIAIMDVVARMEGNEFTISNLRQCGALFA